MCVGLFKVQNTDGHHGNHVEDTLLWNGFCRMETTTMHMMNT